VSRPRVVFFTYYRLVPTGQIGVFKRCLRLIERLLSDFDIHLVSYGPLPETDELFSRVAPRITIHDPPEEGLGLGLLALLQEVAPAAVVFGETPLRGSMRLSHRAASALGLWQVALENYYGEFLSWYLPGEWPSIDRWMLLGLTSTATPGLRQGRVEVVPPFVRFARHETPPARDRVCVMGYDKQTLLMSTRLLARLPAAQKADFLIAPQWRPFLERIDPRLGRPSVRVLELRSDLEISDSLARAQFVFGKAGFQQVVEGIALGAPVICQACGGGLTLDLVPPYLRPFVRMVAVEADLRTVMLDVATWLMQSPPNPWTALASAVDDTVGYAADRLRALIEERTARPASKDAFVAPPLVGR
jgi:hypothetical protein